MRAASVKNHQVQFYLHLSASYLRNEMVIPFRDMWELQNMVPIHHARILILRNWYNWSKGGIMPWAEIADRVYPKDGKKGAIERCKKVHREASEKLIKILDGE